MRSKRKWQGVHMKKLLLSLTSAALLCAQASGPTPNPTQTTVTSGTQAIELERTPLFKVTVVKRTAHAFNYRHRSGATKIDFRGTTLMPPAHGEAKVESKQGYIEIEVEFRELTPATQFGPEYLTYVMWAITPEGRATNLGEVILNGKNSKLDVSTELQAFGLIVTAEPYFAVTQPSDVVVMENVVRADTRGKIAEIDANYELLQRGQYTFNVDRSGIRPLQSTQPLEIQEARNAVQIAEWAQANKYSNETFEKARSLLRQAEDYQVRKQYKPAAMTAREAVQTAEDSRLIALRRIEAERQEMERQAAADREAKAKQEADEAARQRSLAEEQQRLEMERRARAEEQQRQEADRRAQAEAAAAQARADMAAAERAKAEAEAARQAALAQQQQAEQARLAALAQQQALQQEAERARMAATQAETEKENLRRQLLEQFNMILQTRDSARGLIVNMSDVLFDTGKWTLRPGAREKLAKVAGIILGHPGLKLEVEGHTDSVGSDEYNMTLSDRRAQSVRDYLVSQGIAEDNTTARGFGEGSPVASNDTAAGRQQNRRVELVVSGEVIGTKLSDLRSVEGHSR
jgi:outer membrane protein OmpA-like peptidoglycan-associated protein